MEKMLAKMLSSIGLTPAHAATAYQAVMSEVAASRDHRARMEAEIAAFKAASAQLVQSFQARLTALENRENQANE